MEKPKVPYPENLEKRKKLEGNDWARIQKFAGIKHRNYVSEIYRGLRKESPRIKAAYEKLMKIKEYERKILSQGEDSDKDT